MDPNVVVALKPEVATTLQQSTEQLGAYLVQMAQLLQATQRRLDQLEENTRCRTLSHDEVLGVMKRTGRTLADLAGEMEVFPQIMQNVRVSDMGKGRMSSDPEIRAAIEEAEKELGENGRVLVRVSGTEPLVRVMLEGKDEALIEKLCGEIAEVVRERLI